MENRQTSKKIKVGDRQFEIKKMDPRTACWLFSTLADKAEGKVFAAAFGKLSKQEFDEIQGIALKHVYFLDDQNGTVFPTALVGPGGKFSIEIEADELFKLTSESILFSISPFLVELNISSQST